MTEAAPIRPRRIRPHGGDEARRRLSRPGPAAEPARPAPSRAWRPPAWPLHLIVALLMLGGAHAVAASKAPAPAAGALPAPSVAVAPPVPGCGPRRTMRGAIRFEAPPIC